MRMNICIFMLIHIMENSFCIFTPSLSNAMFYADKAVTMIVSRFLLLITDRI